MASDTQATDGNRKISGVKKVFATKNFVVGIAGSAFLIDPYLSWILDAEVRMEDDSSIMDLRQHVDTDFVGEDVQALIYCRESAEVFHMDARGHAVSMGTGPAALGSGEEYALGAMHAGASALEAVQIAAKFDIFTGFEIFTYDCAVGADC